MEEEAEKLKDMQKEIEGSLNLSMSPTNPGMVPGKLGARSIFKLPCKLMFSSKPTHPALEVLENSLFTQHICAHYIMDNPSLCDRLFFSRIILNCSRWLSY